MLYEIQPSSYETTPALMVAIWQNAKAWEDKSRFFPMHFQTDAGSIARRVYEELCPFVNPEVSSKRNKTEEGKSIGRFTFQDALREHVTCLGDEELGRPGWLHHVEEGGKIEGVWIVVDDPFLQHVMPKFSELIGISLDELRRIELCSDILHNQEAWAIAEGLRTESVCFRWEVPTEPEEIVNDDGEAKDELYVARGVCDGIARGDFFHGYRVLAADYQTILFLNLPVSGFDVIDGRGDLLLTDDNNNLICVEMKKGSDPESTDRVVSQVSRAYISVYIKNPFASIRKVIIVHKARPGLHALLLDNPSVEAFEYRLNNNRDFKLLPISLDYELLDYLGRVKW